MLSLQHGSLQSTLTGIEMSSVVQFRGIPYGQIPERFAQPQTITTYPERLDCTRYGPRCPQVPIDVGHLLRIPREHALPIEPEDEYQCLNLDVVIPKTHLTVATKKLPVMVWIHGGSQAVTFGSAASGVCDMTKIVEDSLHLGKSIIVVAIQYRLNIFAFGDDTSSKNLSLQDQALALKWVQNHISGFGGDPNRVTVAGESAGAVFSHAHLVTEAPARQYILSSGSLHLSPPLPQDKSSAMRQLVQKHLRGLGDYNLRSAPVSIVIEALKQSGIQSWYIQEDPRLENWQHSTGAAERLLLSDVQNEAILWHRGMWATDTNVIVNAFDLAGENGPELKRLYNIHLERPSASKTGALDFLNDCRFVLPIKKMTQMWRMAQKPVFRCLLDELNPWQPSSGSHHGLDLIVLFGGFDLSFSPTVHKTGIQMRKKWIEFIHSEEPWSLDLSAAFGPWGEFRQLDDVALGSRRRMRQVEFLETLDHKVIDQVFMALAVGKISLLN
ncbi:Alpha/Beta hydrolase protein [Dactylonectria macrodidyma]|uniref:Carboxylic ester hydrolase n=1 Tax=Dactylonectria macrodidyma TaxID=307937 RepID=A0A9P9FFI1_9HYPO|nr:Alpha/Beta hydrolase protein [Dactylonectria macrodidyma]